MRLSDYLIRPVNTSTEQSGQYNLQLEAYNLAVNLINNITSPTAHILGQIKADTKALDTDCNVVYAIAIDDVLQIIDKYTRGQDK